jgi:hypothetical protein
VASFDVTIALQKQKITQTNITITLSLQLDSLNMVQKFVFFIDVLNSFLMKYSLTNLNLNNDEIEKHILCIDEVILSHNIGSDVVLRLDVKNETDV